VFDPRRGEAERALVAGFVHDQFANGRQLHILNIVDDVTKECLSAIPDTSISGRRVARELSVIIERRGKPGMIVSDHGTGSLHHARLVPRLGRQVALHRARKPMQNGFIANFNGRMRDELLIESLFFNLDDARAMIAAWVADFNLKRLHSSLGYLTPAALRHQSRRNRRSASQFGSTCASRCRIHRGSNRRWMKNQSQVRVYPRKR
jgi:transposase InsO family protein